MTRYFIAGNVWLLVALAMFLGRRGEIRLFVAGGYHNPAQYDLLTLVCMIMGVAFLVIARRKRD